MIHNLTKSCGCFQGYGFINDYRAEDIGNEEGKSKTVLFTHSFEVGLR